MEKRRNKKGYTLVELLVVIGIIGLLATIVVTALIGTRAKARDTKRKSDLTQIGRFLSLSCYVPDAGSGSYDLAVIAEEFKNKNPQYANYFPSVKDPKTGTDSATNYFYIFSADANKCALYANLENENEKTTLGITAPAPGGGTGIFSGPPGPNGANLYFQISN